MIMYYLAKFCRICIQTGGKLIDIDSTDSDSIKFSEKLKTCTQMVLTRESLSTQICSSCISKLRISYQFHSMCKKSTTILQRCLEELLCMSDNVATDKLVLAEVHANVSTVLPKPKRKRIGKDERCSLLKKLLSKITQEQILHNIHINGLTKLCNRILPVATGKQEPSATINKSKPKNNEQPKVKSKGGLRNLIDYTKGYVFDYNFSNIKECNKNFDLTPLEQLEKFTETFFCDHFLDYKETILHLDDNLDLDSDEDEQMFDACEEEINFNIKEEVVIVEPDVNLKKEYFFDENTSDFEFASYDQNCSNITDDPIKQENYLFDENYTIKQEEEDGQSILPYLPRSNIQPNFTLLLNSPIQNNYFEYNVPENCLRKHRTLSPYSVKCRTRGNPFINPQLKNQFQTRNFKCSSCNRRFKSPGYLKAHCSRLKH